MKAMEKNPAERYGTAQELADDLRRFLEDRPIRARWPTLLQRARKWSRRHKPLVRLAAVAALLLVATAGALLVYNNVQIKAEQERTKADSCAAEVKGIMHFLVATRAAPARNWSPAPSTKCFLPMPLTFLDCVAQKCNFPIRVIV